MDYIASIASKINVQRHDYSPNQTPPRTTDDATSWQFDLYKTYKPPRIEVPQSPEYQPFFPITTVPTPAYIDLELGISQVQKEIGTFKASSFKKDLGKNQYAYRLKIEYRIEKLTEFKGVSGRPSYVAARSPMISETRSSPYYTSKAVHPPQKRGDASVDMESKMRDALGHLYENYDTAEFKDTTLFSNDKKADYYRKNATKSQLASLYFHSEVQASSDDDGAKKVAREAVQAVVNNALSKRNGPYTLVVVAGIIEGFSEDRTVCGNACKMALAHLGAIIEAELTRELHHQRDHNHMVKMEDLKIRRSAHFSVSTHVGAGVLFSGLEAGANIRTSQPTLSHRKVNEYAGGLKEKEKTT